MSWIWNGGGRLALPMMLSIVGIYLAILFASFGVLGAFVVFENALHVEQWVKYFPAFKRTGLPYLDLAPAGNMRRLMARERRRRGTARQL